MSEKILFQEKQYLGINKSSLVPRLALCIFCFVAYYWSENPKPVDVSGIVIGAYPAENIPASGTLFFLMGMAILVISVALVFVLHIHTKITETSIILDGLWTSRKVKIDLKSIVSVKKIFYGKYNLKLPAYNLHSKGKIRFYTGGYEAVELTDKDGLRYRIGSQKADELLSVMENCLARK